MAENLDRDTHKGIFEIINIYLHVVDPDHHDKLVSWSTSGDRA